MITSDECCCTCGGLISTAFLLDGEQPCTCVKEKPLSEQATRLLKRSAPPAEVESFEPVTEHHKVCVSCGMDLVGKKRLKNNKGYWCPPCAEADSLEKSRRFTTRVTRSESRHACHECGRMAKADELMQVEGNVVCITCAGDRSRNGLPYQESTDANSDTDCLGKRCNCCGADVSNERRFRDERGYWCEPCYSADTEKAEREKQERLESKKRPQTLRCLECGQKTPTQELSKYKGLEVCPACIVAMKEQERAEKEAALEEAKRSSRFKGQDEWMVKQRRRRNCYIAVLFMALVFVSLWQNRIILHTPQ